MILSSSALYCGKHFLPTFVPGYRRFLLTQSYAFRPCSSLVSSSKLHATSFEKFGTVAGEFDEDYRDGTFFSDDVLSWSYLELSNRICNSLLNAGLNRPSLIQAASIPSVLSGKDVVIAAETGSGKTHAYLVPIIDNIIAKQDDCRELPSKQNPSLISCLILCPNSLLCNQVVKMANGLCDEKGKPILNTACVSGQQGWPVISPDIIVSTPGTILNAIGMEKRSQLNVIRSTKYVVFDEADMLFSGGFQRQIMHLINILRGSEKELLSSENRQISGTASTALKPKVAVRTAARKASKKLREELRKQYIFVAATLPLNGEKTAGAILRRMFPGATRIFGDYLHYHSPRLEQTWIEVSTENQVDALIEAVKRGRGSEARLDDAINGTMIFANSIVAVESIAKILRANGIKCHCYHKERAVEELAVALADFRESGGVLVCTDAAARGVDILHVSHVIQAEFATSAVDFLHRVGRTARAGLCGHVTCLYTEANRDLVNAIREAKKLGQPIGSRRLATNSLQPSVIVSEKKERGDHLQRNSGDLTKLLRPSQKDSAFSRKRSFRKKLKTASKKETLFALESNANTDQKMTGSSAA